MCPRRSLYASTSSCPSRSSEQQGQSHSAGPLLPYHAAWWQSDTESSCELQKTLVTTINTDYRVFCSIWNIDKRKMSHYVFLPFASCSSVSVRWYTSMENWCSSKVCFSPHLRKFPWISADSITELSGCGEACFEREAVQCNSLWWSLSPICGRVWSVHFTSSSHWCHIIRSCAAEQRCCYSVPTLQELFKF